MKCMYCLNESSDARGVAHVFPEAVFINDTTLPMGGVCDGCNNYLKKLDSAFVAHNHIWPLIQMMGLPGKRGRPRKKLGFMERSESDRLVSLVLSKKNIEKVSLTSNHIQVHAGEPEGFSDSLFRRALHHIAFNSLAFTEGCGPMLDEAYDGVRRYIRRPKKGEAWPYVQRFPSEHQYHLEAQRVRNTPGLIVRLGVFHNDFYVDLLNTGKLHGWADEHLERNVNVIPQ